MLFFNRAVVVAELQDDAQSPEEGEKAAKEFSQRAGTGQLDRKEQADKAESDQHEDDVGGVHGKDLADDERNIGQVFTIVEFAGQEEIRCGDDELQSAGQLDEKGKIHVSAPMISRKGTMTRRTKGGGKSAKMGSVTTASAKACPRQPRVSPNRAPRRERSAIMAAP